MVTEGEEWKRQRRICAPAFSDVRIYIDLRALELPTTKCAGSEITTWYGRRPWGL